MHFGLFFFFLPNQGWQTLLGVSCSKPSSKQPTANFEVSAIKGDTIYTLRPRSAVWIAPSFEEGILLGRIELIIRGVSLPVGSHDCHVKLHLGLNKHLYISLQAAINH